MSGNTLQGGESAPEIYVATEWDRVVLSFIPPEKRNKAEEYFAYTLAMYSRPERQYHNLTHIANCLRLLGPYNHRSDYLELWLALFWHDVIYDTQSPKNEENSAELAVTFMDHLRLPGPQRARRLIISTKSHQSELEDEQLACAIDLSILATQPDMYAAYATGIRQEYAWVPEDDYRRGRIDVLTKLKAGGGPFRHPDFVHLNPPAITNMDTEIQLLEAA